MKIMKQLIAFILPVIIGMHLNAQTLWNHGRLQVTPDGHYLQFTDGTPFFWLGDTGWELFHRLTVEEIKTYLDNRSAKGFNVIQAVALAEFDGLKKPNQYGEVPLQNLDPTKPNEKYFTLVDSTIHMARERNLFIGLLPTWGDKVLKLFGAGPVIFDSINAYKYGYWLGNRYKKDPNIIWIIGGDRPAKTDTSDTRAIWRQMAQGIIDATGHQCLITYHPWGESSSTTFWKNENWLDVNMLQSGHARQDIPVWEWINRDRNIQPVKPILDGEPNYEDHPINWNDKNGYFRAYDVRKQTYRSVFAGGCGVTYGNQCMWQFYSKREEKVAFPERFWTEALDRPGAYQVGYLKKLIESRQVLNRIPDSSIIFSGQGSKGEHIEAFRAADNSYAMIYLPVGKSITLNTNHMTCKEVAAWWYNPKDAAVQKIGKLERKDQMDFTSPTLGIENDWVLVIDDATKNYKEPGLSKEK